ncbi:IclR family transcriptional regulator [Nocardioides sp.]|uniref:IclR family transcriptional regulator n=1 Tax=Nocardioides sp. TaxID=35761 RepID=UPI002609F967|nr:IclR family transcriptional regulator [Nocardioides sp.]
MTEQAYMGPHLVPDEPASRPSVLARTTWILELFLSSTETWLLEDIASETGLPRSTAFRLVTQLVELGWLVHDRRGGYRLGIRAHALGARTMATQGTHEYAQLRSIAAPLLTQLHRRANAAVHLGVLEGGYLYYLDKIGGIEADQLPSRVGNRVLAYHTAMGRAMLATLPPEDVDTLYQADPPRGPVRDLNRLHQELAKARSRNNLVFARAEGNQFAVAAVAAPILGLTDTRAVIGLSAPPPFRPEIFAPLLLSATHRISDELRARIAPAALVGAG